MTIILLGIWGALLGTVVVVWVALFLAYRKGKQSGSRDYAMMSGIPFWGCTGILLAWIGLMVLGLLSSAILTWYEVVRDFYFK